MKLRLVEAAQPISKLEYNIEKNILPTFNDAGFNFGTNPLKINEYIYTYRGNSEIGFASLRLNTASKEIDVWNETNSDEYVGDLFATLTLDGEELPLGVISSKDPKSVKSALSEFNLNEYKLPSEEDIKREELIPPKEANEKYGAMTKEQWQAEYKKLQAETDEIRDKLRAMEDEVITKEFQTNEEYQKADKELADAMKIPNADTYWKEHKVNSIAQAAIERDLGSDPIYRDLNDKLKKKSADLNTFYNKIYPLSTV